MKENMLIDLTFNNKLIRDYFEGDNSYIPVSELIYVHEHPLITKSFLVELEVLINKTTDAIAKKNITGKIVDKLTASTMKIGAELPSINPQNAPVILEELRNVYKLCNTIVG